MFIKEAYLIKVEHQIKLTYIVKVLIQDLNKVVNCFKVIQVVVIDIHTDTEVQSGVSRNQASIKSNPLSFGKNYLL